jgi:hypothetical protein
VKPKNIRQGTDVAKGYEYSALLPAFTTYLTPASQTATTATSPAVADVADGNEGVGRDDRGEVWDEFELTRPDL